MRNETHRYGAKSRGNLNGYVQVNSADFRQAILRRLDVLGEVTIAPITSTIRRIPSEVILTPEDGLPKVCAINLDHVQTVSKAKVGSFITTLSDSQMDRVKNALLFALGF